MRSNTALHRIVALLRFGLRPKVPVWAARGERWGVSRFQLAFEAYPRYTPLQ